MKQLFVLLALAPLLTFGQNNYRSNIDTTIKNNQEDNPIELTLVDSSKGSKLDLFIKIKSWFAKEFVSSKSVIEMEDKDAGKIIGKAIFQLSDGITSAHFTITVDVKENKFRCQLTDFIRYGNDNGVPKITVNGGSFTYMEKSGFMKNSINKYTKKVRDETENRAISLLDKLKKFMLYTPTSDF